MSFDQGRRLGGGQREKVPSKLLCGGDGDAYVPPKFQKYLIKYKFLQ